METKLSGMPVSVGKKDSLLGKATETKDRSSATTSKSVSVSLNSDRIRFHEGRPVLHKMFRHILEAEIYILYTKKQNVRHLDLWIC